MSSIQTKNTTDQKFSERFNFCFDCPFGATMWSGCDVSAIAPAKNAKQKKNCGSCNQQKENWIPLNYSLWLKVVLLCYSGVQIRWQRVFCAGNQGIHQNFNKSLLTYKCWLIFMRMKQKKFFFFEKKKSKWPTQKKVIFQLRQFSKFFHENFMDWSLGWQN